MGSSGSSIGIAKSPCDPVDKASALFLGPTGTATVVKSRLSGGLSSRRSSGKGSFSPAIISSGAGTLSKVSGANNSGLNLSPSNLSTSAGLGVPGVAIEYPCNHIITLRI